MLLIDSIERYKANTNRAIGEKLEKISTLERQINALSNEIQKEKMKQLENIQSNSIKNNKNDDINNTIFQYIQAQNSLSLLKFYTNISLSKLKLIKSNLLEKSIQFLITKCQHTKNFSKSIIKLTKSILLGIKLHFSGDTQELAYNYLNNIMSNKKEYTNYLGENDFIDIKLLLSHLSNIYQ